VAAVLPVTAMLYTASLGQVNGKRNLAKLGDIRQDDEPECRRN